MARCRPFLPVLAAAALTVPGWTQQPPTAPPPPGPKPFADQKDSGPPGPDGPKDVGERREPRPGWGPPGPGKGDGRGRGEGWGDKRPRENLTPEQMKERAMRDLEKLTPEQRNEVWRCVWAVLNLPPEKRQELIGMEDDRRKKVKEEIDKMLQNTGIQVPDDQRRKFFYRYFTGRRAIEEQLKAAEEDRRQALMTELEGKLKQEFGSVKPNAAPVEVKADK